jgi:hypothetical protein
VFDADTWLRVRIFFELVISGYEERQKVKEGGNMQCIAEINRETRYQKGWKTTTANICGAFGHIS